MNADSRYRALAARHDGVVAREALRSCGLTDRQIHLRVTRGELIRRHEGVYLISGAPLTLRARVRAALMACGPAAFASHRTAAWLWLARLDEPDVIDVSLIGGNCGRPEGVRVHRPTNVQRAELRMRTGIRLSSPARAVCELAAIASRAEVEFAIQEAAARGLLRPRELEAAAKRWGRRSGAALLRSALEIEAGVGFTRSHAERLLLRLIDGAHLPVPEKNVYVEGYLVDAVWRQQRLIVEIDGFATHGTRVAFAADRARDAALLAAGWRVLRFTYAQLRDEPMLVLAQLVRALSVT